MTTSPPARSTTTRPTAQPTTARSTASTTTARPDRSAAPRSVGQRIAAVLTAAVAVAVGTGPAGASPAGAPLAPSGPTDPRFAGPGGGAAPDVDADLLGRELAFRQQMGLSTDLALVTSLLEEPSSRFGFHLTGDEAAQVAHQFHVQAAMPAVEWGLASSLGDRFGGVRIDHTAGGEVVALVVAPVDGDHDLLTSLLPPGTSVAVEPATHSLAQLRAARDEVTSRIDQLQAEGTAVVGASIDLRHSGTVTVEVEAPSIDGATSVIGSLGAPYRVVPVAAAPSAAAGQSDAPISSARRITRASMGNGCTAGFLVAIGQQEHLLTAGHCEGIDRLSNQTWRLPNYSDIGKAVQNTLVDGTNVDAARIPMHASLDTEACVWLDESTCMPVGGTKTVAQGSVVAKSGARTQFTTATYTAEGSWEIGYDADGNPATLDSRTVVVHDLQKMSGTDVSCAGDSGSPTFVPGAADRVLLTGMLIAGVGNPVTCVGGSFWLQTRIANNLAAFPGATVVTG